MACAEEGCFSITWEIENFSILLETEEGTQVCSPVWNVEHTEWEKTWWRLYAINQNSRIYFQISSKLFTTLLFDLLKSTKMSFLSSRGEVPLEKNGIYYIIKKDIFHEDGQSILLNDTLTLLCRIRGKTTNQECLISSVLQSVNYLWKIKDFDSSCVFSTIIKQNNFLLEAYLKKESLQGTTCTVIVQAAYADNFFSFVDLSLSIDGGQACVRQKPSILTYVTYVKWVCDFELKETENMDINLDINGIVALHKICQGPKLDSSSEIAKQMKVSEAIFRNSDDALVDDVLLCAALYYAADKYDVRSLKEKCADILKAGLTVENACDALAFADKHSDEQLMKFSVDFIRGHQELFSSSEWKKLEKNNPSLVIEVFRKVFVKKETT